MAGPADAATCAEVFGQPTPAPSTTCSTCSPRACDLGALLANRFGGSCAELVRSAGGSAAALVGTLATMPLAHDVAVYRLDGEPIEVPFHKRAQITVSHLDRAFGHQGLGRFDDVGELTVRRQPGARAADGGSAGLRRRAGPPHR